MPEYKISCPHCGQHLVANETIAGKEVACPACQGTMKVPVAPAPGAPATKPLAQISTPVPRARAKRVAAEKSSKRRAILTVAAVLGGLGILLAVLWPTIMRWQAGLNEARNESGPGVVGGQMSHIAELNSVLDATDPARFAPGPNLPNESGIEAGRGARGPASERLAKLPLAPAKWSLQPPANPLPEGRANGSLAGTNFLVESTALIMSGGSPVLALREGDELRPEREVLIYLRLKRGETVEGRVFQVQVAETRPEARVMKRWQAGGLKQAAYGKGFALRLEFGKMDGEVLPGKLFLALPDNERSVVCGLFYASVVSSQPGSAGTPGYGHEN